MKISCVPHVVSVYKIKPILFQSAN